MAINDLQLYRILINDYIHSMDEKRMRRLGNYNDIEVVKNTI